MAILKQWILLLIQKKILEPLLSEFLILYLVFNLVMFVIGASIILSREEMYQSFSPYFSEIILQSRHVVSNSANIDYIFFPRIEKKDNKRTTTVRRDGEQQIEEGYQTPRSQSGYKVTQ